MTAKNGLAVIWDVDGTLVDTAELHFAAWARMAKELGRPFSRQDFAATFGRRNPEILNHLFGTKFSEERVAELGDLKEDYYKTAAKETGVLLLPGARHLLQSLHQAGFVQAIGSSAPRGNIELIMGLTDTKEFFEAIVSMEDTQRGKPDPQVFLVGAAKLGVSPAQCVVIEDAVAGVQAAKAGGMRCIAVRFVGHHSEEKLRLAGSDLIVDSLEKVSAHTVRQLAENGPKPVASDV
ncbi:MAG: HAD family hydrolase [Gemmataceae bacterium]